MATATAVAAAGKYLTFKLEDEVYGLDILKVQEIIGLMTVTRVPRLPAFVRGVINLRGKVIPVIDLRRKFGLDATPDTYRTCIVVVQVAGDAGRPVTMGILVDTVSEVMSIAGEQIEASPSFGTTVNTEFIQGMGKAGDTVIMLLDIDRVLTGDELSLVGQASQAAA